MAEQDFLTEIRETEKQAALLVDNARDEARRKLEQAREQAVRILSQGRDEATALQQKLMQDAESKASLIRTEADATTSRDIKAIQADCEARLEQAAQALVERIVNADAHR